MCLPVINQEHYDTFVYGGHLYLDNLNGHVNVGGGSVLINPHVQVNIEHEPFCAHLFRDVRIFSKDTFFYCGGYEEKMFVGLRIRSSRFVFSKRDLRLEPVAFAALFMIIPSRRTTRTHIMKSSVFR